MPDVEDAVRDGSQRHQPLRPQGQRGRELGELGRPPDDLPGLEAGPLAARVGAAVPLGALLTPVAALLPLIDPGNAEDTNCGGLVNKAKKDVATKRVEAPKKVAPAEVAEQPTGDRKRGTQ